MQSPKKDPLHELILTLSSAERRYFKIFAGQNVKQGKSIHLELFDCLAEMEIYQEQDLEEKVKKKELPAHLAAAKYQLRKLLLKSLRAFHKDEDETSLLRSRIRDIDLLYNKGLYRQAHKVLLNSLKKAQKLECHSITIELLDWQLRLIRNLQPKDLIEQIRSNQKERAAALKAYSQENRLQGLYTETLGLTKAHMRQKDSFIQEMKAILAQNLLDESPLSFLSGVFQCQIQGLYHLTLGQYKEAAQTFLEKVQSWESHSDMIFAHPEIYMLFQLNFLNSCFFANKPQLLTEFLPKIRLVLPRLKGNILHEQRRLYQLDLMFRMNFGHLEAGREVVSEILDWLRIKVKKLSEAEVYSMHFNCAVFFFVSGDFPASLQQVQILLRTGRPGLRKDIYDFALIFELILHTERKNLDLLDYRLRSARRQLTKEGPLGSYFGRLIPFFRNILNQPESEIPAAAAALKAKLEQDTSAFPERLPLGYHEMLFWLESKEKKIPIQRIYSEALLKRK